MESSIGWVLPDVVRHEVSLDNCEYFDVSDLFLCLRAGQLRFISGRRAIVVASGSH